MEKLMQYVWQHRLWLQQDMVTVDGRRVRVIDQGRINTDSGPDFFNAKILIGDQMWAGDVEIHVRASDWHRHGHDNDRSYDSVVLHVVEKDDCPVYRTNGELIPQLVMACAPDFSRRYSLMVDNPLSELPCSTELLSLSPLYVTDWLSNLAYERLYDKVDRIMAALERYGGNWSEVVYVTLARALGFGVNGDPFERLALCTPLRMMLRHSDSLLTIEAILFGQAGFLDDVDMDDHYIGRLKEEYAFIVNKFGLRKPECISWKLARMRPQNFPHRRIATLAAFIYGGFGISGRIFNVETEEDARSLFDVDLTGFWARRYNFSPAAARGVSAFSRTSAGILVINVVVPLLYAYGSANDDAERRNRAVSLLQELKPERNNIVEMFERSGISCPDAFTSQAMIQLRRQYCQARKCLYCRVGHRLLAMKVKP